MLFRKVCSSLAVLALVLSMTACTGSGSGSETGTDAPSASQTTAPTFRETVLVDDENCTVSIKGVDADNLFGYTLQVYLENKTGKELMFSVDKVSVNGYMCDPFWAASVSAGKKSNEQISFSASDFEANGIEVVEEISFTLNVYDNNDWSADYLVEQAFTVNP